MNNSREKAWSIISPRDNQDYHINQMLYDDVLPIGRLAAIKKARKELAVALQNIKEGVMGEKDYKYYVTVATKIGNTVTKNRNFIIHRSESVIQSATYWHLAAPNVSFMIEDMMKVVKKLMDQHRKDPDSVRKMKIFPFDVILSDRSTRENIEAILLMSSLGFVLQKNPVSARMPSYTALKFLDACLQIAVGYHSYQLKANIKIPRGATYPKNEKIIRKYKNRAYFIGLSTLKNFSETSWIFFISSRDQDPTAPLRVLPTDAPGWIEDVLYSLDMGDPSVSTEDAIEYSTEALETKHRAEVQSLTETIKTQDMIIKRVEMELRNAQDQQESIASALKSVKSKLDKCMTESYGDSRNNSSPSYSYSSLINLKSNGEDGTGYSPQQISAPKAPPAPEFKNYVVAVNQGSTGIKKAMDSLKSANESLYKASSEISVSPVASLEIEKSKLQGRSALLSDIRKGIPLRKVKGPDNKPTSMESREDSNDLTKALRMALMKRQMAVQYSPIPGEGSSGTSQNFDFSFDEYNYNNNPGAGGGGGGGSDGQRQQDFYCRSKMITHNKTQKTSKDLISFENDFGDIM